MNTVSCKADADVGSTKEFAIAFVVSVTEVSDNPNNWIAKKGKGSLFEILRDIYPEVMLNIACIAWWHKKCEYVYLYLDDYHVCGNQYNRKRIFGSVHVF